MRPPRSPEANLSRPQRRESLNLTNQLQWRPSALNETNLKSTRSLLNCDTLHVMISAVSSIRPSLQIPFVYLTTVCLLATAAPASAHSTTSLSADDSAALTRSAAASASVAPTTYREFVSDSPTTASTAQDTERTEVRASNSGNSITHFSNNESFSVSLPGSSSTVTRSSDSTVATLGDGARSDNFTLAITSPAEGEAAVHSILLTESAPQTFSYTFHDITRISSDGHGGADLFYADSNDELVQVGHVERAWARDAIGRPVPTHYEIHGKKLTPVSYTHLTLPTNREV